MSVLPRTTPDSAPLWEGYKAGKIRMPWCADCGRPHLPPAPVCPHCLSERLEWRTASGEGSVSTWVVVERRYFADFEPPYVVVQVQLDEGPRLTANMAIGWRDRIRLGMRVRATFRAAPNSLMLPMFEPIGVETGKEPG